MSRIDNRSFSFVRFVLVPFVLVRCRLERNFMKVTIEQVIRDLPAVDALLMQPHTISFVDESDTELPDEMDITITCDSISVDDVRISIMFPDGYIADYEIQSDCYHRITII